VRVLSEAFINESNTHDLSPNDYLMYSLGAGLFIIPNTAIRAIKAVFQGRRELLDAQPNPKPTEDEKGGN
jgi:hypothetical protein